MKHKWTGLGQGINSGLCDCNFHGEIIFSECVCGEYHSWCRTCWINAGNDDEDIFADAYGAMRYFHQNACIGNCSCEEEMNRFQTRWEYLTNGSK